MCLLLSLISCFFFVYYGWSRNRGVSWENELDASPPRSNAATKPDGYALDDNKNELNVTVPDRLKSTYVAAKISLRDLIGKSPFESEAVSFLIVGLNLAFCAIQFPQFVFL